MTFKKGLAAMILATAALAACGSDEKEEAVEQVEQVEEEQIDLTEEVEQFRAFAIEQMEPFVADLELLVRYVKEGKLEEAQKLYPLVHMYYERLQPMKASFAELDATIDSSIEEGKENEATGFAKLEYGLFNEKTTTGYEVVVEELFTNVQQLSMEVESVHLDGQQLVNDAVSMLDGVATTQLTDEETSYAFAHIYDVKANTEAVEEIVKIFMSRADTQKAANVTEKLAVLNDTIAYYEVGKEDYVNYSYFTSKQKEELIAAVSDVRDALKEMNSSLK